MSIKTIFHAHNWQFTDTLGRLDELEATGYDAVQISPAQKSAPGRDWYLRYQPFDYLEIEGLGSRQDLAELCGEARRRGLTIIADVVFNHMAVPQGLRREHWLAAEAQRLKGDAASMEELYAKLSWFPHLTRADFQPWRDMQGAAWDSDERYESWGNGEWPELRPSANVLQLHRQHLTLLYGCGVRGFRFDAVKHMRARHVAEYVRTIQAFAEPCWCYGEVFSADAAMHREYDALFPTTDFPFIRYLKRALCQAAPITLDPAAAFLSPASIRFGMNHDLACNAVELVAGLLFGERSQTRLANCLALVLAGGTALVFAEEHAADSQVRSCVAFRRATGGLAGVIRLQQPSPGCWRLEGGGETLKLDFSTC